MMQTEGERLTMEDKRELEKNIEEMERRVEIFPTAQNIKKLRQLRRKRT